MGIAKTANISKTVRRRDHARLCDRNEWNWVACNLSGRPVLVTHTLFRNARPNNNQLITHYLPVCYLLRIQQYLVNTTYNIK